MPHSFDCCRQKNSLQRNFSPNGVQNGDILFEIYQNPDFRHHHLNVHAYDVSVHRPNDLIFHPEVTKKYQIFHYLDFWLLFTSKRVNKQLKYTSKCVLKVFWLSDWAHILRGSIFLGFRAHGTIFEAITAFWNWSLRSPTPQKFCDGQR